MEYTPRRKLTREFKLEAVRQVALSEKPKAQLARELGVRVGQLRMWRLEFEKEAVSGIAKLDRGPKPRVILLRAARAASRSLVSICSSISRRTVCTFCGHSHSVMSFVHSSAVSHA
jgi:transposase-like protein